MKPLAFEWVIFDLEGTLVRADGKPMPGARTCLERLRQRGARIAVASHCTQAYLEEHLRSAQLEGFVEAARCLESPLVRYKADMLEQLVAGSAATSAVMVGDRDVDWRAADANALPFVHVGSAPLDVEPKPPRLAGLEQLEALLDGRAAWLESAAEALGFCSEAGRAHGLKHLAVCGRPYAGKSAFAGDLARDLRGRGVACSVLALDDFLRPEGARAARPPPVRPEDHLEYAFDVERLIDGVLEPHARGEPLRLGGTPPRLIEPAQLLIVEGVFLLHPRLRLYFDRSVFLEVDLDTARRRARGRHRSHDPLAQELRLCESYWPAHEAFERGAGQTSRADLRLDGRDPLALFGTPA